MTPEELGESDRELDRTQAKWKRTHNQARSEQRGPKPPKRTKQTLLATFSRWTLPTKLSLILAILGFLIPTLLGIVFWLWPQAPKDQHTGELTDQVRGVVNEIIANAEAKEAPSQSAANAGKEMGQSIGEGLKGDPYNVRALMLRGTFAYTETLAFGRPRFRDALNDFEKAAQLDNTLADPHFGLGTVLYQIGLFDLANRGLYKIYEKGAVVFDKQTAAVGLRRPKWQFYPDARNRLVLQAALDQFQEGQRLKQISTRSSDGTVALFFYSQNVEKTVRTLRALLGYDPVPELDNELMMEFNAMISLVNSREGTEVFDFRERGQQRDEDEAKIALNKGDLKEALRLAELAMQEDPRDAGPHITRATVYVRQGNWQQALDDYAIAVQLDPVNIMWLFNRAVAHARLGQKADAIADFEKCLAMNPHPFLAERVRDELAKLRK